MIKTMYDFYSILTLILIGLDSQIIAKALTILIKRHNHVIIIPLHKREQIQKYLLIRNIHNVHITVIDKTQNNKTVQL